MVNTNIYINIFMFLLCDLWFVCVYVVYVMHMNISAVAQALGQFAKSKLVKFDKVLASGGHTDHIATFLGWKTSFSGKHVYN